MSFYYLSESVFNTSESKDEMSSPPDFAKYAPNASSIEITQSIFYIFDYLSGLQLSLWSLLILTLQKHHLTNSLTSIITFPLSNNLSNSLVGLLKFPSD